MAYNYEYPYVDPNRYNSDWLIKRVYEISEEWKQKNPDWEERIDAQDAMIEEIKARLDDIAHLSPGFLERLISMAVRNVWFSINESGYFIANIPQSWSSIRFATTGYDTVVPCQLEYGHLALYDNNTGFGDSRT